MVRLGNSWLVTERSSLHSVTSSTPVRQRAVMIPPISRKQYGILSIHNVCP